MADETPQQSGDPVIAKKTKSWTIPGTGLAIVIAIYVAASGKCGADVQVTQAPDAGQPAASVAAPPSAPPAVGTVTGPTTEMLPNPATPPSAPAVAPSVPPATDAQPTVTPAPTPDAQPTATPDAGPAHSDLDSHDGFTDAPFVAMMGDVMQSGATDPGAPYCWPEMLRTLPKAAPLVADKTTVLRVTPPDLDLRC